MVHCPPCKTKGTPPWVLTFANVALLLLVICVAFLSVSRTDQSRSVYLVASLQRALGVKGGVPLPIVSVETPSDPIEFPKKIELLHEISPLIDNHQADVETTQEGFLIRIKRDALFVPGSLLLQPEVKPMLLAVAGLLAGIENLVQVIGYMDNPSTPNESPVHDSPPPPDHATHAQANPSLVLAFTSTLRQAVKTAEQAMARMSTGGTRAESTPDSVNHPSPPIGTSVQDNQSLAYASAVVRFLSTEGGVAAWRFQSKGLSYTALPAKEGSKGELAHDQRIEILIARETLPTETHAPGNKTDEVKTTR